MFRSIWFEGVKSEAFVAVCCNLLTAVFKIGEPASVQEDGPRFPRDILPCEPGRGFVVKRLLGQGVRLFNPIVNGFRGRFDVLEFILPEVFEGINDLIDLLLNGDGLVRDCRHALLAINHEHIRKLVDSHPDIGLGTVAPLLLKCRPLSARNIDIGEPARDRVEAGRQDDYIIFMERVRGPNSSRRKSLDGGLGGVNELNVVSFERFVVIFVEGWTLGAVWIVVGIGYERVCEFGITEAVTILRDNEFPRWHGRRV